MKVSITLPSLYPESLYRTLNNLASATQMAVLEVIVVAPFRNEGWVFPKGKIIWVEDTKQDGCNSAHNLASLHATGDFMFAWADDHTFIDGWDTLAFENFYRREAIFRSTLPGFKTEGPFILGLRQIQSGPDVGGRVGTIFGKYYPYFPLARMDDVKRVGGWFSAEYKHGWGDPDFALRVLEAGGMCEWADDPSINVNIEEDQARHGPKTVQNADVSRFLNKWTPKFGVNWPTDLRGFNRDVLVSTFPPDVRSCSFDASAMPQHGG